MNHEGRKRYSRDGGKRTRDKLLNRFPMDVIDEKMGVSGSKVDTDGIFRVLLAFKPRRSTDKETCPAPKNKAVDIPIF